MSSSEYRQKLSGLISRLHGEYYSDEPPPFSGIPGTINIQTQQQSQSVQVQILLDMQSLIYERLPKFQEGTPEKSFLEKLKSKLSSVSNVVELFSLCMKLAKDVGLNIESLFRIFG